MKKIPLEVAEAKLCSLDMIYKVNRGDRHFTMEKALQIKKRFPRIPIRDIVRPSAAFLEVCRIIVEEAETE